MTNVDEVPIDFVVRNKKKPVLDLKLDDVAVTDDGSAVKLSHLRLMSGESGTEHLITFLFDPLDPSSATNAHDVAKKILKLIPAKGFSFSVFTMEGRLRFLQEFTSDRSEIQKAIRIATGDEGPKVADPAAALAEKSLISAVQSDAGHAQTADSARDRELRKAMLAALTESQRIVLDQHMPAPLAGVLALVRSQAKIPGRKLLIYFSNGSQSGADVRDAVRSIAAAANRSDVSVYVINKFALDEKMMDGLMESNAIGQVASANHFSPLFPAATQNNPAPSVLGAGVAASFPDMLTRMEGEGLAGSRDPLSGLATGTGGAYIFSEDNLKKPIKRAVADLTTYYEASYLPTGLVYDGKFHQISVKTLRPGLKIQARAGYFAIPPAAGLRAFEVPLMKVLAEAQLPTDVGFRSTVLQLGNLTTGNENTLVVEVPISKLEVRTDRNANLISWHVSIVSEIKDKSGATVEHFSEDIPGHSALNARDDARNCATMQRHFALPPGQYTLETVVLDRNNGKLGGERTQLNLTNAASGPFLSDVALVRQIDSSAEELDPFEPLRYQHGKVIPDLSGEMTPGTKEMSFFFLVHPDSVASEPATLEMQVLRNDELVGQVPLQIPKQLGDAFPYLASLRTASLPGGNYDVRVSLSQNGRIIERDRTFSIAGPQLANAALGKTGTPEDGEEVAAVLGGEASIAPTKRQPLEIAPLPTESVGRPSNDELDALIAGARKQATNYSVKLPNFLCVEVTDRSVDPGNGRWRRKDSFGELLRYVDNQETRRTLEVNGQPSSEKRTDMNGTLSIGQFAHLLSLVFQPSSQADFHWKETDALATGTVQVFEYRVDRKHEAIELTDSGGRVWAAFHGLAYIDSSTFGVRRITMEADNVPPDFSIHAASISVDYDYVTIGAHDYLMPVRGTIRVKRGKRETDLNQIVFQDYRRYASQSRIIVKP
ncbi:MAG TPA: VWA domain-containing protein [Terriglobales bacterium]|nr:VWA domain-containing protein [Terriglobales bacterium]